MKINSQNLDVLKRAFPHLDDKSKQSINILLKFGELSDSLESFLSKNNVSACDVSIASINQEELLKSIRPVCSKKEREYIDLFVGLSKYREIMTACKCFSGDTSPLSTSDFIKKQLSPEQLQIINSMMSENN